MEKELKDLAAQPRHADEIYRNDPAYTEDVRHLALPMRRNSGPDSVRRKSCSLLDGKIFDRDTEKYNTMHILPRKKQSNQSYKYDAKQKIAALNDKYGKNFRSEDSTSSDELNYVRRGQSLDRNIYKQQKKQMLCFQREKETQNRRLDKIYHRKASSKENLLMKSPRSINEFATDLYDDEAFLNESQRLSRTKERPKQLSSMLSLNDRKYSSLARSEAHSFEQLDQQKTKEMTKFQIGKRFLRGEIGIKSFNYYLLKESLKSSKKSTTKFRSASVNQTISKSEENIYEEIFYTDKKNPQKANKLKNLINYPDCELCIAECTDKNCDICKASEQRKDAMNARNFHAQSTIKCKTPLDETRSIGGHEKLRASDSHESISISNIVQTTTPSVLQYQSYNPNNPGVYKIETTPVAFTSDYNPIEEIYRIQKYAPIHKTATQKISSSSSDSLHHHQKYTKPSIKGTYYDCSTEQIYNQQLRPKIYKTDSKASILSEMSIKSENSNNRYYKQAEMSDSSMGDSMFSYPAQRRYYGSAESCQFGYECQPCVDGDKCSFSDNCRYECRNCDCSSSYFSSDFDDGNFSRKSSARISTNSQMSTNYNDDMQNIDIKTTRYAEDFMKHLNNVKKTCNYQAATNTNQVALSANNQLHSITATGVGRGETATVCPPADYGSITKQKISNANTSKTTTSTATVVATTVKVKDPSEDASKKSMSTPSSKNSSSSSSTSSKSDNNGNKTTAAGLSIGMNRSDDAHKTTNPNKSNPNPLSSKNNEGDHLNDEVFEQENGISNEKSELNQSQSKVLPPPAAAAASLEHGQNANASSTQNTDAVAVSVATPTTTSMTASLSSSTDDKQDTTDSASVCTIKSNTVAPSTTAAVHSPKLQRNDGNGNNVSTRINTTTADSNSNGGSSGCSSGNKTTQASTTQASTTESKYAEPKNVDTSVVSEFAGDASSIRDKINTIPKSTKAKLATTSNSATYDGQLKRGTADATNAKVDRRIRRPIIEHHFTLPYKTNKKRHCDHRKNATLERSSTKKNTLEQLVNKTTTVTAIATATATAQKTNIETTKMHYHNPNEMPKYLFGERNKQQHYQKPIKSDEIYLNKSGWVQVREPYNNHRPDTNNSFQKYNSNLVQSNSNTTTSKLEALITRSEIRKVKCTIDPQLSAMLSERPGFLPIKTYDDNESPPPITPIISPPPAFQDCKTIRQTSKLATANGSQDSTGKMVFSRSFEYDTRKPYEYDHTFSKSFDYDFLSPTKEEAKSEKENAFPTLTSVSSNYLPDKSRANQREPSVNVYQQYLEPKEYVESTRKTRARSTYSLRSDVIEQPVSRRGHVPKQDSSSSSGSQAGFRAHQNSISKRLNSCDSGARSDLSNDEADEEEEPPNKTQRARHILNQQQQQHQQQQQQQPQQQQQQQLQNLSLKQRSLTPENLTDDQITSFHRTKAQPTEKRLNHSSFEGSQGSLLDKNSLRNNTLDRQHLRVPEKTFISSRSSSSSSCSEAENELIGFRRSKNRASGKSPGENRIRRSRSLQLTERSPNRSKMHKTVVQISGNNGQKERPINRVASTSANRRFVTNNGNNNRLAVTNERQYKDVRNADLEKSRSLDSEYERYQGNSRTEFDKSRSFDENYSDQVAQSKYIDNYPNNLKQAAPVKPGSPQNYGNRYYDPEMIYDKSRKSLTRSPLMAYKHEAKSTHPKHTLSSVRGKREGERSPNLNREIMYRAAMTKSFDHLQSAIPLSQQQLQTRDHSPTKRMHSNHKKASPGSDYDLNASDFNVSYDIRGNGKSDNMSKEAKLMSEYYFGNKANAESYLNQRRRETTKASATPSASYSCANSSCACGQTGNHSDSGLIDNQKVIKYRTPQPPPPPSPNNNVRSKNDGIAPFNEHKSHATRIKTTGAVVTNTTTAAIEPIYVNRMQNQSVNYINSNNINDDDYYDSVVNDDVTKANESIIINASKTKSNHKLMGKPPSGEKYLRSFFGLSLDEREMPITRERSKLLQANCNTKRSVGDAKKTPKLVGSPKLLRASTCDAYPSRGRNRSPVYGMRHNNNSTGSNSISSVGAKIKELDRLRSRSLPCLFMRHSCTRNNESRVIHPHLTNQMRAVSSPSLCENPLDTVKCPKKPRREEAVQTVETHPPQSINTTTSVLQKFRKTFSNLKGKSSSISSTNGTVAVAPINGVGSNHVSNNSSVASINSSNAHPMVNMTNPSFDSADIIKYRFGPLIWRTSKERRKTKHHRRDKCNSGDSGIQVELENDENVISNDVTDGLNASPSFNVRVRRANSAKVASNSMASSAKARVLKRNEGSDKLYLTPIPGRSLSQPYGLNQIAPYADDSDTDSEPVENGMAHQTVYAEVLYTFKAVGAEELSLERGALVEVLRIESGPWWWGRVKMDAILCGPQNEPRQGWFPRDFVKVIEPFPRPNKNANAQQPSMQLTTDLNNCDIEYVQQPISPVLSKQHETTDSMQPSQMSNEAMKENVTRELLETEENYVKLLSSLCIGYLKELRQHPSVFPTESLILIFSNIEKIFRFQQKFLDGLRYGIEHNKIAETFLEFQSDFMVYSTYCNSYPRALMELETYTGNSDAMALLESCRTQQNLPELPLSAHLLAPIQRICRYPLHLSELVKHSLSKQDLIRLHEDDDNRHHHVDIDSLDSKESFEQALACMKRVTEMVNEGKRHSEYLSRIQARFDSYEGPPISVHSTRLFLQIDAIRMTPNIWNNTYTLFLFDRQLIYCKKDLLKRTNYIYKGRIFLDSCRILNLPDGRMFGLTLKNALRIFCETRKKWLDFCFRSSSSKLRFLNILSAERQFCGQSLFVSEIAGIDDEMFDREFQPTNNDYVCSDSPMGSSPDDNSASLHISERGIDVENLNVVATNEKRNSNTSLKHGKFKKSDTLPKKSRKLGKEQGQMSFDYQSNSLGRKRIGNWFGRKSKSTNSTPSQSPTHQPIIIASVSSEESSSQSSPAMEGRLSHNNTNNKTITTSS
ncbi:uncharacterized protein LOC129579318 isoform X2 [Sitodiplosis mosellana]|uniref:uncharacterized protein LOC129579318 isoform X2 n=1 Tax=Sitodiplosis mosellana TaxID=263140 RepID=UPI002443CDEE|nr:uncharacterized protein LOC129579318 isoform X2 [Sitodiplosis mosellana]